MIFREAGVAGAYLIEVEPLVDERGFFARTFCRREFADHGLEIELAQCSLSFNPRRGTLRGMHYQAAPHAEAKLIRCTRGSVHDVLIDLRRDSPTFKRHCATTLSAENRRLIYAPPGVAHGFLTLEDDSELSYQMSEFYHPESSRGVRWDDPAFGIPWPAEPRVISHRDRSYPDFAP